MAFGAGVLISALAFDLAAEAAETSSGDFDVGSGLFRRRPRVLRR